MRSFKSSLLLILLAVFAAVQAFASPISEHGKLSVSGRKILDKNNQEYVLRGMSMYWNRTDWPGGKFYTQGVVNTLAGSGWNSNVVRAAIGNGNVQDAKNFMDWTATAGIYVIIDWHYHTLDENGAKNFFSQVAQYAQQKSYTHVIYEIFNEPCDGKNNCGSAVTWTQIKSYAENVIRTIRQYDTDGLVIVGTPSYSSSIGAPRDNEVSGTCGSVPCARNVMYAFHFYAAEQGHGNYKTALQAAWCDDLPVFISEWGTSAADGGRAAGNGAAINQNMNDNWMSIVETMGMSWANWSVSDAPESSAALPNGASTSGGWSNLTPSGRYAQKIINGRNTGGSISSVGLSTVLVDCNSFKPGEDLERDGIAKFNAAANSANYKDVSGADSSEINSAWILKNNSGNFNVSFTLTEIPKPGTYMIRFRAGSINDGTTVSWSGSGVQNGVADLKKTTSLTSWTNSTPVPITLDQSPSTDLNFTFNAGGANSVAFVNFAVYEADSADSSNYGISPILSNIIRYGRYGFEMQGNKLILLGNGNVEIYSLHGKRVAFFANKQNGEVIPLQNLSAGAYLAVLRNSGKVYTRKIYLK